MKKNDCNVIRDLMPLVLDRVASDESRALVEEHMGSCGKCRKQYEEMKAEMPGETRAEYEKEQKTIVDALKQARRKKRRRLRRATWPKASRPPPRQKKPPGRAASKKRRSIKHC